MSRNITLRHKTGFKITDPSIPVNIRDYRGIMFYTTEPYAPNVLFFNLPAGSYIIDSGKFSPLKEPIKYRLETLPPAETFFSSAPTNFEIQFADNPSKCTIFWEEQMIVFDNSFRDRPLPELFFIYFHEMGHAKYFETRRTPYDVAEAYCDLYSSNEMLKMGFNPSQIMKAPRNTLSSKQELRKEFIDETMLSNNGI